MLHGRKYTHLYYSMMTSCSHSSTTNAPSLCPTLFCYNKLHNYMFAEAPLPTSSFPSLPLLFSSQLYNPHIFWTALDPMKYVGIIYPILHIKKLRIREIKQFAQGHMPTIAVSGLPNSKSMFLLHYALLIPTSQLFQQTRKTLV